VTGLLNALLALLLVGLAAWTIGARRAFTAVVGFLAYGLVSTLAWLQLRGIDVALTEAAIGAGLTGVLLVTAAARLRGTEAAARAERPGRATRWLAGALAIAVSGALALVVLALPVPAPTLAPQVAANLAATDVGNPITAVLLAFRSLDTLLEAIVLVFALLGVWSLSPDRAWGGMPGPLRPAEGGDMLTYVARVLPPIGIVAGAYVFWVGADEPGGKFQGATILAAMWLLVLTAGLAAAPRIDRRWLRGLIVVGPLAFVAVGVLGAASAGAFLGYPTGFAKPLILVVEFALLPTLVLVLGLLLLGPAVRGESP
jgi:multisubunit Na+/H+ antiporter MnhB subunit